MRRVSTVVLQLMLISLGLAANHIADVQNSKWNLANKLIGELFDVDNTTLGKTVHRTLEWAQLQPHREFLPRFAAAGTKTPPAPLSVVHLPDFGQAAACNAGVRRALWAAASVSDVPTLARTWSNRGGNVLTEVVPGEVWAVERPFLWNTIDVGGKTAVVKLSDGSLWVHSPVELNAALRESLAAIGPVAHIVSPNYEHVKYAQQWKEAYPTATLYGCPGLTEKEKGIAYDMEIGQGNEAPTAWGDDIRLTWFDCEVNPFLGGAFFNEVVFLHVPSQTLIVTDLYWNYPGDDVPTGTWLWKQGMDKVYLPFYKKFMVGEQGERCSSFKAAMARVEGWDFDRLLPCHGDIITSGGKRALRDHLQGCR